MKSKKVSIRAGLKKVIICFFLLPICLQASAQYTVQQTDQLGVKADSLDVAALNAYIEFIIKQDSKLYYDGTNLFKQERDVLNDKMKNGTSANTQLARFEAMSTQAQLSHLDLYSSLYGDILFKGPILRESADDRKKKVTWNDQEYKLTSDSRSKFKELNDDLETAQENLKRDQDTYNKLFK